MGRPPASKASNVFKDVFLTNAMDMQTHDCARSMGHKKNGANGDIGADCVSVETRSASQAMPWALHLKLVAPEPSGKEAHIKGQTRPASYRLGGQRQSGQGPSRNSQHVRRYEQKGHAPCCSCCSYEVEGRILLSMPARK
ncbi:hypothetical protein TPADAL_0130 [Treponema pallidum subsp. pallidum DAL-1]|uniref:Uncharacterized protein n=4 Tax=Treponema pallidum subsp. pallidum TaxID=161 RepID=O83167_TREPA|nr:predicted coding region TP0130 [Treponema pallidum subsp. pallidum str. Nichols]ACD70557.1 hypothetical protein TPASS_0130 [Treponema pallidum subsp. pallidum SS14]ADR64404.1 conserved hypothetical protein [Treponema pallidum subsp. pallidum]ADR64423.1 conserved hypothetical protein [Treponema pallidum subsp. pallidum str. Mexico A]AEZ60457.1 hypothetical protein TPADAL_0130 [Treponema pallidum subsp. pallidum DAL-1]QFP69056.1 hypothetical protein FA889_00705 [Treponema pallidum]